jgi:Fusaric acid resistance protein-like
VAPHRIGLVALMVASALLLRHPPVWAVATLVGLLGVVRPLLRARNYLLYSLVMTPLILLMLDAGRGPDLGVLFDRVLATLIGSGLVLSAGMVVSRSTAKLDARYWLICSASGAALKSVKTAKYVPSLRSLTIFRSSFYT